MCSASDTASEYTAFLHLFGLLYINDHTKEDVPMSDALLVVEEQLQL
jgi:hypothetical protein